MSPFQRQMLFESRATLRLAFPLIIGQLSQMLVGLTDTLMIGKLGVVPLAAATFANSILYLPLMFGIGMTMAVSIRVSQARGAGDQPMAREALRNGLFIALVVGLLTLVLSLILIPFFHLFGQDPEVTEAADRYFLLVAASMIPAIGTMAIKNHADAMNHPWPAFWILLGGVALNVLLNWIFIWGKWGAPELGLEGAGLATLLARIASLAGLVCWCRRSPAIREWVPRYWWKRPHGPSIRSLVKVGLPASLQLLAEVSAFVAATMLIGMIGKEALAAHQVAITCAATVFMVPLGLSMALTVRVGEAWGAKEPARLRPIVVGGWLAGSLFTVVSSSAVLLFPGRIAAGFIDDSATLGVATALLVVSAAFQFSDTLQILSIGALRGLDDVTVPAWVAVFAYWVVSLPIGSWFAFGLGWGAPGIWWGITIGLTVTAAVLGRRLWRKTATVSSP